MRSSRESMGAVNNVVVDADSVDASLGDMRSILYTHRQGMLHLKHIFK